jgi:hypothetical protein
MRVGANAADPLNEVQVLDIGTVLAGLFNAAVVISEANCSSNDLLAFEDQQEVAGLL